MSEIRRKLELVFACLKSPIFKYFIALTVLFFLFYFRKIDIESINNIKINYMIGIFTLSMPPLFIVAYRFKIILESQGIKMGYIKIFNLNMIGSFFDLALPSSNGGDLVKAAYLIGDIPSIGKIKAFTAVIFDRVAGLIGMFMLTFLAMAINWEYLGGLEYRNFIFFTTILIIFGALAFFKLLCSKLFQNYIVKFRINSAIIYRIHIVTDFFKKINHSPKIIIEILALSILNQIFWCGILLLITLMFDNNISLSMAFIVFPITIFFGIFGVAGGFGFGTAAFGVLFSHLLSINTGVLIGLFFQFFCVVYKILGLPFYLFYKKR